MRLKNKNLPKLTLVNLLRRRKTDLKQFLEDSGIVAYESLKIRCSSLGVSPPTPEEFKEAGGGAEVPVVSSPTEGVVVVETKLTDTDPVVLTSAVEEKKDESFKSRRKKRDFDVAVTGVVTPPDSEEV